MISSLRYRTNSPVVINEIIDGEAIIINLETGHYYSLDEAGAAIWNQIEGNATIGEIMESVMQAYDGSCSEIEAAVMQILDQLRREQLIVEGRGDGQAGAGGRDKPAEATIETRKHPFHVPALRKYTDMQDLLLLDPIHEVDELGWPSRRPDASR